jgi:HEAT repeat protein
MDDAARRRAAAMAGHTGDEATARSLSADESASVRATALAALVRMGRASAADVANALDDADAGVRRRALAAAVAIGAAPALVVERLRDRDATVVEAAAWALGEIGEHAGAAAVAALVGVAGDHADPLCREAAVAALGAIGDPAGLPAILVATTDKPAIRRRAVIALTPFDGPDVDAARERARSDRDWQVREAAEQLSDDR